MKSKSRIELLRRQMLDVSHAKYRVRKPLSIFHGNGNHHKPVAIRKALGFELINVHRVEKIVLQGLERGDDEVAIPRGTIVQGSLRFLRQSDSFAHSTTEHKEDPAGDS